MNSCSIKKSLFLIFMLFSSKKAFAYDSDDIFCNNGSSNQSDDFLQNLKTSCLPHVSQDSIRESVIKNILLDFRYHAKSLKNEKTYNIHDNATKRIRNFINEIACPGAKLEQNVVLEENILNACKENIKSINCENGRTLYSLKDGTVLSIPSEGPYRNEIILKKIAKEENCIKYKSLFNRAVIRGANATSEWLIERTFNKKGNAKPEDGPTTHESNPHSKD